jgi:hypothetical protein
MRKGDHLSELQGDANLFARRQGDGLGEQPAQERPGRQAQGVELTGTVIAGVQNLR